MSVISLVNLPASAPYFVGRIEELSKLREFWSTKRPAALAVVGLGGVGKTALVSRFVQQVVRGDLQRPEFVFGWSFYQDRRPEPLFEAICRALGDEATDQGGRGAMERALGLLTESGRALLVLDGLEVIQRPPKSDLSGAVTDPILDQFLRYIIRGTGELQSIITTRFSPAMPNLEVLSLGTLSDVSSEEFLRETGVTGSSADFRRVVSEVGGHALTLQVLGSYLTQHLEGDIGAALELVSAKIETEHPAERNLAAVLESVDARLDERERALLARICLFRTGVDIHDLEVIFANSDDPIVSGPLSGLRPWEIASLVRGLEDLSLIVIREGLCTTHPVLRNYFIQGLQETETIHQRLGQHYARLLVSEDQPIPHDAAEAVLEVIYHLTQTRNFGPEDIRRLAERLQPEETPTVQAYSSLLEAALQLEPRPPVQESPRPRRARVFISYVREDTESVAMLRSELEQHGVEVWQDTDRLMPGRRWKQEIRDAIQSGDFFLACFSENYAARERTYMNEELLLAIEELRLRPSSTNWFIPAVLTPTQLPSLPIAPGETLRDLQWVDLHRDWDTAVSLLVRTFEQT
jgi:hypothetical protein